MEILLLCGIYFVEQCCYRIGLKALFDTNVRWSRWIFAGGILPIVLGMLSMYPSGKLVIITLAVLVMNLFLIKGSIIEKVFENVLLLVLTSCLDDIFEIVTERILMVELEQYIGKMEKYLFLRCCSTVVVIITFITSKKFKESKRIKVSSFAYFVVGLAAISMMSGLAFLDYVKDYFTDERVNTLCEILDVVVHINVFFLVFFIVNIRKTNTKIEELLKTEKMLKSMQAEYYRNLLKKEDETRKYRHDMNNHFYYIQTLLENEKIFEAKKYFLKLQGSFKNIQNSQYLTGNEMVDIIMNYYFSFLPEKTRVNIEGKCPVELAIEDVDICIIFSNVFKNVVEAMVENNIKEGEIDILVNKGKAYVEYVVANTFFKDNIKMLDERHMIPITHKSDRKYHGIGLINVKNTVEKNSGIFTWKVKEEKFYIKIILPILTV